MARTIGIITLNGYYNYGNRLQNYATEQVLMSFSFDVKTIINNTSFTKVKNNNPLDYIMKIKNIKRSLFLREMKNIMRYIVNKKKVDDYKNKKTLLFKEFSSSYLNETDYYISINNIPENLNDRFDFFVTGSDQVWNPHNVRRHSSINFLTFAPKEKRIAYAPSFGVSKIPPEDVDDFKKWISDMHKLSVREYEGAEIIKKLTGRDAVVLVDPTMMLTRDKWLSISKKDSNRPDDYLLTYILGDLPNEKERQIRNFADENDLKIVDLAMGQGWSDYIAGPREYIDYISSANAVFTDSFHGTIFSILFDVPFVTFERIGSRSMISRINTLLTKFNFENRLESNINLTTNEVMDTDFSNTDSILAKERKKTYDYLEEAFNL